MTWSRNKLPIEDVKQRYREVQTVLATMKEPTVTEACRQLGIADSQYYKARKDLREAGLIDASGHLLDEPAAEPSPAEPVAPLLQDLASTGFEPGFLTRILEGKVANGELHTETMGEELIRLRREAADARDRLERLRRELVASYVRQGKSAEMIFALLEAIGY